MNSLSIHTERSVIEITTRPAKLIVENSMPRFRIRREPPAMKINRKMPEFDVNWDYVNATSGRMSPVQIAKNMLEKGRLKTFEAIGSIVQRGDILKDSTDELAITKVAVAVTVNDMPKLNVGLMPKERARIEWDPGYCTIEWTDPVLQIEWDSDFRPTVEWEPYSVEVRLRNHPLVHIRVNMENIPEPVGRRVDQKI